MCTYVDQLANALGKPVFDALVKDLEADPETGPKVRQIRKSMAASHYWCSLFLALAEAVAAYGEIWDAVAGMAKQEIIRSLQPLPKDLSPLASKVADLLVNRAVGALRAAAAGSNPVIAVLDSPQTLRALRILAIFCCPSPPRHPGIEQNCVKPLLDDGEEMLRDETRSRLANAFGLADHFMGVRLRPRSDPFEDLWPDPAQSSLRVGSCDRLPVVAGNDQLLHVRTCSQSIDIGRCNFDTRSR
jgi:hypothetical protein